MVVFFALVVGLGRALCAFWRIRATPAGYLRGLQARVTTRACKPRKYALLRVPISLRSIRHAAHSRLRSAITSRTCAAKAHKVGDVLLRVSD